MGKAKPERGKKHAMQKRWMWLVRLAVYAAALAANVGYFWWSWKVGFWQAAASAAYLAVNIGFLCSGKAARRTETLLGALTAAAGGLGLLVRAGAAWLTIPALLLAGVFVTPLYGLTGMIADYDFLYAGIVLVGCIWWFVGWRMPGK